MFYFKNQASVLNALSEAIKKKSNIAVYGDYDVDGLFSLMIFKDMFYRLLDYETVYLYPYSNRTHKLDGNFLNFCLSRNIDFVIICDTGSNDMDLLLKFSSYGISGVILDHHVSIFDYNDFPEDFLVINTKIDERFGIENKMCGAAISFVIATELLKKENIIFDIGYFATYALIAMYADCIVMYTDFARYLYDLVQKRKETPIYIDYFLEDYFAITRRFAEYIISPKINAVFRREQFSLINRLFMEEDKADAFMLVNQIKDLHQSTIFIINTLLQKVVYEELNGILLVNLSLFLNSDYPNNFIVNHKGRVANAIASREGKPCICVCDTGKNIGGSFRDPQGRDYLQYFSPLIKAGGHPPAFGFSLPYMEWERFREIIKDIGKGATDDTFVKHKLIDMTFGFDILLANKIALENEFASSKFPAVYLKVNLNRIVESSKYNGFSYLIWSDSIKSYWATSDRKIHAPCSVILYPYLQKNLKLTVVWD